MLRFLRIVHPRNVKLSLPRLRSTSRVSVGIPSGRCFPSAFGIHRLFTGRRTISACLEFSLYPFEKLRHSLFLDGSQRDFIHARRSPIAAHSLPRFPQNVTPVDPVVQRVESPCLTLLGTHP